MSTPRTRKRAPPIPQPALFARAVLAAPARARRGRPKKVGAALPHTRRPAVDRRHPHHVTVRVRRGVWNLRSQRCFRPIAEALRRVRNRPGFRVVHFSVQGNHLHLVTEAADRRAMTQGMRALLMRIAKRLNRVMRTRGRLFADRFHERILATPTEVRNVVRYVLHNHARHLERIGKSGLARDPFSSAVVVDAVSAPTSWLLTVGLSLARAGPALV